MWAPSITNYKLLNYTITAALRAALVYLLSNIEQNAHARQGDEQRCTAVGNKRQGDALGGQDSQHHADVEHRLQHHHAGNAHGQQLAKGVLDEHGGADAAVEEEQKQAHNHHRAYQSHFLGGGGKDEVGVRFGQVEQLLFPFHQAHAHQPSRAYRNHGLNNVEAVALGVSPGIQEGQNAVITPLHAKNKCVQDRGGGRQAVAEIAQPHARHKEHGSGDAGAGDGGTQVRLFDDQPEKNQGRHDGGQQRVAQVVHLPGAVFQEIRQKEDECGLGDLRGLQREPPGMDPAVGVVRAVEEEHRNQQQRGHAEHGKNYRRLPVAAVVNLHGGEHGRQPRRRPRHLPDQHQQHGNREQSSVYADTSGHSPAKNFALAGRASPVDSKKNCEVAPWK